MSKWLQSYCQKILTKVEYDLEDVIKSLKKNKKWGNNMKKQKEKNSKKGKSRENHCDRKIRMARSRVIATGNKWLMEDFNARYGR